MKDARLQELQAALRDSQAAFNAGSVGRSVPVLVTGPGRRPGQMGGRTPCLQPVHFPGPPHLFGREVPVQIAAATPTSLSGHCNRS